MLISVLVLSWHNITPEKTPRSFPGASVPQKLEIVTETIDAQHFLTRLFLITTYFRLKGRIILRESFCQMVSPNLPPMCWMQCDLFLIS